MIEIKGLGKKYRMVETRPYLMLRDVLKDGVSSMLGRKKSGAGVFWALKDINLEVKQGDRLGIIGRNGAGKSTMLKILSRITPPTVGEVRLRGRVASLLEVGTGFHPELTGRENIFLNGSILGLSRKEINSKLDEIIDFSGVEKFIETPLKHYSSGMELRLAFSVAAHLDPEILIIDEVLAVGDINFQNKCIGKMEEVSRTEGRTILFVTHNLHSLRKLCNNAVLLDEGHVIECGSTESVIEAYVSKNLQIFPEQTWEQGVLSRGAELRLLKAWLHDENGNIRSRFDTTEQVCVSMEYDVLRDEALFIHGLSVYNRENVNLFSSRDLNRDVDGLNKKKGRHCVTARIPGNLLPDGLFTVSLSIFPSSTREALIQQQQVLCFETFTDFTRPNAQGAYTGELPGLIRPMIVWENQ